MPVLKYYHFTVTDRVEVRIMAKNKDIAIERFKLIFGGFLFSQVLKIY